VSYFKTGDKIIQNNVFGFIKFGSRMDIMLPLGSDILVEIGDSVVGTQTPIARIRNNHQGNL
jgi:phosphatidylserine decarboxylase